MISAYTHVFRLIIIVLIGVVCFFGIKGFFVPDSWDSKLFYRVDALEDLKQQPLRHGGNQACASSGCHAEQQQDSHLMQLQHLGSGNHKGLACENCHGPVSLHVNNGSKINAAKVHRQGKFCLQCHAPLISKPESFPKFSEDHIGHWYFDVDDKATCIKCHDPHKPGFMPLTKADNNNKLLRNKIGQISNNAQVQPDMR